MMICICSHSPVPESPPQLHLRSSGIRFSYGARKLDPLHAQFTVGFSLLWESNATANWTGGGAQAVVLAMRSGCKYRWSFVHSPATHLLLWGPVPNRPWTTTGPQPRGWGPLPWLLKNEKWFPSPQIIFMSIITLNIQMQFMSPFKDPNYRK